MAKSNVIFEVKPFDENTNMKAMERKIRRIKMDGLVWGVAKVESIGYGINKLEICGVVEDDKVSVDQLQEKILSYNEFVQSVDIAAFNKV